jgi:hypothetical protein
MRTASILLALVLMLGSASDAGAQINYTFSIFNQTFGFVEYEGPFPGSHQGRFLHLDRLGAD